MKSKFFLMAFIGAFAVFLVFALIFAVNLFGKTDKPNGEITDETPFLDRETAVFMLIYTDGENYGPFSLLSLDGRNGRLSVFSFSGETSFTVSGNCVPASKLYAVLNNNEFLGIVEENFGTDIFGYMVLKNESIESVLKKAGGFDFSLPKDLVYKKNGHYIDLAAGNQNINGKKFTDILFYPPFEEDERANILSRLTATFLGKRLKRINNSLDGYYSLILETAETDIDAYGFEDIRSLVSFLAENKKTVSCHVICETELNNDGFRTLTETTKIRVKKYLTE